jgi:hypothetical protein
MLRPASILLRLLLGVLGFCALVGSFVPTLPYVRVGFSSDISNSFIKLGLTIVQQKEKLVNSRSKIW